MKTYSHTSYKLLVEKNYENKIYLAVIFVAIVKIFKFELMVLL